MRILSALLFALLIPTSAGCASPFVKMSELNIDPYFSPKWTEDILSAQDEWARRVPATKIPIYVSSDQRRGGYIGPAPKAKCDRITHLAYTQLRWQQAPRIFVCMSKVTRSNFRQIVLHELGHAHARRGDHIAKKNIMHTYVTSTVSRLTRADVRYVKDGL